VGDPGPLAMGKKLFIKCKEVKLLGDCPGVAYIFQTVGNF